MPARPGPFSERVAGSGVAVAFVSVMSRNVADQSSHSVPEVRDRNIYSLPRAGIWHL